ncbi:transcriptional regulator, LysR family [Methylobacterium sp. 4-46]|uniref:LysR family transcriptional regulator n=1 Tax=unclassified Methylobacterium TaxID=2615210 RepID=UPI000152BF61|nr:MULTISPECIES: LysR family transcriptional regulator [Methylobacterium]ACA19082.1 transcriptional regulator, LysR family [Methylobacterium sp. 4-46]WFT78295.1 LysR family transcriptional regulator [Methylobacterium nodulans]
MLTLRQIEVARAIMVSGTIAGAARLLNVSAPGISRLMKYTEAALGMRLFDRQGGRLVPSQQARAVFDQINAVYDRVEDLRYVVARTQSGSGQELLIGSVPSICHVMVPRAVERLRAKHPQLLIDINILKLEEAIDYLLLGKGEVVAMSYRLDHPGLAFEPLARGSLLCIVPESHPLAGRDAIEAREIVRYPLIGIDPNDPYGRVMADIFRERRLAYEITIRARFGTTVCALVRAGLGIAVIDQFTIAEGAFPGIRVLRIAEAPTFQTWTATKAGSSPSLFASNFVSLLRQEMTREAEGAAGPGGP